MRAYTFEFNNEKERNIFAEQLFILIKDTQDFKDRDLMTLKWEKLGLFYAGLMVADCVPGSFTITSMNAFGKSLKTIFMAVKSEMPTQELLIPDDVKISIEWKEDSVNRYKVIKTNFNFLKKMLEEGVGNDVIMSTYGIELTDSERTRILEGKELK